jgi:glyoxylase-like metal-dependent hydrolase (beta-lactamase superfamily II)
MEEISPGLYSNRIPLPRSPLGYVNSYVIRGTGRSLIIDTGLNHQECRDAMFSGLNLLGMDLERADFFLTHFHEDHIGLVPHLATDGSMIQLGKTEADMIVQYMAEESESPWWKRHSDFLRTRGFPESELPAVIASHPDHGYEVRGRLNLRSLREGDVIDIGEYSFNCIETPGHSPGHICLHEPRKRLLISGDHVLGDITPIVSLWSDDVNPLKDYLASLEKVSSLDVDCVLPGHGEIMRDLEGRIRELRIHHNRRAEEVLRILSDGVQDAFRIASQMSWDIPGTWEVFPPSQRWFAFGEALAHVKYLEEQGEVRRQLRGENIVFSLA